MYLHEREKWWNFRFDSEKVLAPLADVRCRLGLLCGKMSSIGFDIQNETLLNTLSLEIRKSSEIEGEIMDFHQIRSSIANRLGIKTDGIVATSHYIDGVVEMMLDATQNYNEPLSHERLFGWHCVLFPTGRSGLYNIEVGKYRTGAMQVVSGAMGHERVHYEAPSPERIENEMDIFIQWINEQKNIDPVIKSAIAHFWFVTIHPFDDGNGRIARAIADMMLARADGSRMRFYSMSNEILHNRKSYYDILERTQRGDGDITEWMLWYIDTLRTALETTHSTLSSIFAKAVFWKNHDGETFNDRQKKMINRLFDGIEGKMTSSKWGKMCKCSADTALNDIKDLTKRGIMRKSDESGRSTNYELVKP